MALLSTKWGYYKFTLNDNTMASSPTFLLGTRWTDRTDLEYQIDGLGKDGSGFYYAWRTYTYINGNKIANNSTPYKKYWTVATSGQFILQLATSSYPGDINYVPDEIISLFEHIDIEFVNDYEGCTAVFTYGYDGTHDYIQAVITPKPHYAFTDDDVPIVVTVPDETFGDFKDIVMDNTHPSLSNYTTSSIDAYGVVTVKCILGSSYTQMSYSGYISAHVGDLTGILIKDEYDVTLSLDHITASNTSTTASSSTPYTNTLTADVGYTLDDVDVIVTMGDIVQPNAYNPSTKTITISQVTGNISISATAKKLHTFTFMSMDGLTTYETVSAYEIKNIYLSISNNTRTLTINGTVIGTYTATIPDEYELLGYSLTPNATRVQITVGHLYNGVFNENTNFYEVLRKIPTPTGDLSLNLYHNESEKDHLFKSLQSIGTITGTLRESCDVINPQIMIEYSGVPDFDYVYIAYFNRYYYVTDVVSVKQDLWIISLKVDVLMTYKDIIKLQTAFVTRNQFTYDRDKSDSYVSFDYDKELIITTLQPLVSLFPSTYSEDTRYSYIVTTVTNWDGISL